MSRSNPYLVKAHEKFEYTPKQAAEILKCSEDPIYFIKKYVKIQHPTKGAMFFKLYDYQEDLVDTIHNNRQVIVTISRQAGKALDVDTPIATPSGFTRLGDIVVGDQVYGPDGLPTTVRYVSEIHHKTTYRIVFDDNSEMIACEDHLWAVHNRHKGHEFSVLSTKQLASTQWKRVNKRGYSEYAFYIPNSAPICYPERDLRIDPYLMGLWLGDGYSEGGTLCGLEEHLEFYQTQLPLETWGQLSRAGVPTNRCKRVGIAGLSTQLRSYGLGKTQGHVSKKRIPVDFLQASVEQRVALLQGLMDTDGFVEKNGTCQIQLTLNNRDLIDDIYVLLCSLGLKVTRSTHVKTNSERLSFTVSRDRFDVCRVPHKLARQKQTLKNSRYVYSRTIQQIEIVPTRDTVCIQVDNNSSLFLASKSFIPTHNTTVLAAYALWFACFHDDKTILIVSNKNDNAMEFVNRVQYAYENLPNWLKPGVDPSMWTKHNVGFDNRSRILSQATTESSGRGLSISFLICDELAHVKPRITEEFWASISPTLATGGKCAISSTPNGDTNLFAQLWRGAEAGNNGFISRLYDWRAVPGRDDDFIAQEIAKSSELKVRQEYFCEFLSSDELLFDSIALRTVEAALPKGQSSSKNNLVVYDEVGTGQTYLIGVDPSKGVGRDFTAIQVFRLSKTIKQVAELRTNQLSTTKFYPQLRDVLKLFDNKMQNSVYFTIESNGVGEGLLAMYESDPKILELGGCQLVSAGRDAGLTTTSPDKLKACLRLKELIESGRMEIVSQDLLREMKTYVRKRGGYEAQYGGTDDLVSATLLVTRLIEYASDYDLNAMNALYSYEDNGLSDEDVIFVPSFL